MSMCTSSCSCHLTTMGAYIWQLIWALHLKIWTLLQNLLLLHRGLFYKRPARTITGQQQQHEMVTTKTTTTTTHSDLHKLLSVQDLIFPIHLWNMNTSSEKLMLICTHHFIIGEYIWALHLTNWPSWTLHLKTGPNSAVCFKWAIIDDIGEWRLYLLSLTVFHGGYIWQLIWALHLKI